MTQLYSRNGAMPAPLPSICYDDRNWSYTAPYADDDLAMLGFVFFADVDLSTHRVVADGAGWKVEPIPAPEPEPTPEPQPISLTVGQLVGRFQIPAEEDAFGQLDDAMMAESRLVKRNWQIDSYRFTEGDGFWTIVRNHLLSIVSPQRVGELLSRFDPSAAMLAEAVEV